MKRLLCIMLGIMFLAGVAQAQDRGTSVEAKAMLQKAVAYVKDVGREKAIAEFNNPKGKFIYKDLYILIHRTDGVLLALPYMPQGIGQNLISLKDADGKPHVKNLVDMAKTKKRGTHEYRWSNPKTKKVDKKTTYYEVVDDMIIQCGYYSGN